MIFVTVGTHEQQFNRLVKKIDELKRDGIIQEDVMIQTGYSTYIPQYCQHSAMLPFDEMNRYIQEARIIISHGGPSSFVSALQAHKIPIVVPRREEYKEHVNNHQVNFCRFIAGRLNNILLVEDTEQLDHYITNYDQCCQAHQCEITNNNEQFNAGLEKIIEEVMKK